MQVLAGVIANLPSLSIGLLHGFLLTVDMPGAGAGRGDCQPSIPQYWAVTRIPCYSHTSAPGRNSSLFETFWAIRFSISYLHFSKGSRKFMYEYLVWLTLSKKTGWIKPKKPFYATVPLNHVLPKHYLKGWERREESSKSLKYISPLRWNPCSYLSSTEMYTGTF